MRMKSVPRSRPVLLVYSGLVDEARAKAGRTGQDYLDGLVGHGIGRHWQWSPSERKIDWMAQMGHPPTRARPG